VVFEPSMHVAALERLQLEADLRHAVERHEFVVHYQPIVNLKDERLVGWEALARWEHPERGMVPPAGFIPLAEETGLIVPIGRWVLEEACQQLREWQMRYPHGPELTMSVNVSGRQFQEPTLIDDVAHALDKAGVDPACLTLELTESVLLENADGTLEQLRRLHDLGVRLAIDDFGTGYSSLSYLRTFPVDILKVDRSFIDGSSNDDEREALLQTILNLGRLMGLQTVGEGIERADQRDRLRELQCDRGQGYYFARPASAHSIEQLLEPTPGDINAAA
jgi:Amt family ammonium transporter